MSRFWSLRPPGPLLKVKRWYSIANCTSLTSPFSAVNFSSVCTFHGDIRASLHQFTWSYDTTVYGCWLNLIPCDLPNLIFLRLVNTDYQLPETLNIFLWVRSEWFSRLLPWSWILATSCTLSRYYAVTRLVTDKTYMYIRTANAWFTDIQTLPL
jgi:hypothetical protein